MTKFAEICLAAVLLVLPVMCGGRGVEGRHNETEEGNVPHTLDDIGPPVTEVIILTRYRGVSMVIIIHW